MRTARVPHRAPRAPLEAAPARVAPAIAGGVNELARKRLVSVVLLIYLLAIFEGSLRKYVAPQFGQYIFFIRDPFLIYAYVLATRFGLWPRNSGFFRLSIFMCFVGALLLGLQGALGGFSETRALLGANGWRSYFLYVPLAFLVGEQFRAADLTRFAKITLLLAVPIAVLVGLQFFSPMNAPINVGIATEKEFQFKGLGLNAERIRPSGPFTSTAGQQQFVSTACAFVLAFLLVPAARRKVPLLPLLVAAGAVLSCVALSGSRGTLLQCLMTGLFAVSIGFVARGAALKAKAIVLPTTLVLLAAVLYPVLFPEGFSAFVNRWNTAAAVETGFEGGVFGRALYGFVDFLRLVDVVPTLGYGLGYGSNASILMRATVDGVMPGQLAETDFARHMVDLGPFFGIGYIVFRAVLVVWLLRLVLSATRRTSDPLPMMLFAYAGYTLLLGQISGHGSITVYGWLFAGLCIAACRVALQPAAAQGLAGELPAPLQRWSRVSRAPAHRPLMARPSGRP